MKPNPIQSFVAKYSTVTHAIAAAMVFMIGAYAEVPQFHAYVNGMITHLPPWASATISALFALYLHYRNGEKQ